MPGTFGTKQDVCNRKAESASDLGGAYPFRIVAKDSSKLKRAWNSDLDMIPPIFFFQGESRIGFSGQGPGVEEMPQKLMLGPVGIKVDSKIIPSFFEERRTASFRTDHLLPTLPIFSASSEVRTNFISIPLFDSR
jgi:hypothetical protein